MSVGRKVYTSSLRAKTLHTTPTTAPTGNGENQYPFADCVLWLKATTVVRASSKKQPREYRPGWIPGSWQTHVFVCSQLVPRGKVRVGAHIQQTDRNVWNSATRRTSINSKKNSLRETFEHFWEDPNVAKTGRVRWIHSDTVQNVSIQVEYW